MNGKDFDHKKASIVDQLRLLGELEHTRFHALIASTTAPDDDTVSLLVLAAQCQQARRSAQKRYFPNVADRHWCLIKSASRLLQISEEIANGDLDEIKEIKGIVDSTISIATGEDISGCESCAVDRVESDL